jgi:hypothetical protein
MDPVARKARIVTREDVIRKALEKKITWTQAASIGCLRGSSTGFAKSMGYGTVVPGGANRPGSTLSSWRRCAGSSEMSTPTSQYGTSTIS